MPEKIWLLKPASASAKKEWDEAFAEQPEIMKKERGRLTERPLDRSQNPQRTHKLRGTLGKRKILGVSYEQWQHEITSSGRIWYCVDRKNKTIWITKVSLKHPKETE